MKIDPMTVFLIHVYVAKARRAILKSHFIVQPRIRQRREPAEGGQGDRWIEFDWLATQAARHITVEEANAWNLSPDYIATLGLPS